MAVAILLVLVAIMPAAMAQNLRAVQVIVSQSEDGPPLEGGQSLIAGESVFFSFQLENYKTGASGKVQIAGHVQAFDPRGTPIMPVDEVVIGTSLSEEDKDWKPKLRSQFQVPPISPPGMYRIRYDAADQQTKQTISGETSFKVAGNDVAPSATLVIRDPAFYRTQDDETALKIPAYRAGDMVWMRFYITGYKFGEQNAIDVAYDVTVFNAAGKQLFSQENAAVEKSQAFYPQPWVPGAFNLTLQSNMNPGAYTIEITARDAIGNQTATARADFRVE